MPRRTKLQFAVALVILPGCALFTVLDSPRQMEAHVAHQKRLACEQKAIQARTQLCNPDLKTTLPNVSPQTQRAMLSQWQQYLVVQRANCEAPENEALFVEPKACLAEVEAVAAASGAEATDRAALSKAAAERLRRDPEYQALSVRRRTLQEDVALAHEAWIDARDRRSPNAEIHLSRYDAKKEELAAVEDRMVERMRAAGIDPRDVATLGLE